MVSALLGLLVVVPSFWVSQLRPTHCHLARCHLHLSEPAVVAEPAEAEAMTAVDEGGEEAAQGPTEEDEIRTMSASWGSADKDAKAAITAKLAAMSSFDVSQDAGVFKAELVGSWKLLLATDEEESGVTGCAPKWYSSILGQTQTFQKPDPMAIFSGDKDSLYFMETIEVIANAKEGTATWASVKGGFTVSPDLSVVESYTRREHGSVVESELLPAATNGWTCSFLSPTLRISRAADGSMRVYEKVDAKAAQEEVRQLLKTQVAIDEVAAAEDVVQQVEEVDPEDDPNDDRPLWQKRIDKADGVKRTAAGTPINNWGPPTA